MNAHEIAVAVFGDEWSFMPEESRSAVIRCLTSVNTWNKIEITMPENMRGSSDKTIMSMRDKLMEIIKELWGIDKEDFISRNRDCFVTMIRMICCKLMEKYCNLRAASISKVLYSFRGRCNIIYYLKIFDEKYTYDKEFRELYKQTEVRFRQELKNAKKGR